MPDFVAGSKNLEDEMNQIVMDIENTVTSKNLPVIVAPVYQAIMLLQEKINQANALTQSTVENRSKNDYEGIPLWQRYSLSIPEAAKYFGIGETRLYKIVAEHPGAEFILEIGSHIKIKRALFERFLDGATCV